MTGIAFAGGGTGGHIYPGLAVATVLKERFPCRIFWVGSRKGMDRSIVEGAGIEFFGIPAGKFRRYFSPRNLVDPFLVLAGIAASFFLFLREKPALVFSKGGFASVPPCIAAALLKIPVFTHESDYSPGLATRINLRFAARVFTAFEETASFFSPAFRHRVLRTGNPVRREFFTARAEAGRTFLGVDENTPVLLVLGGSLGARQLNDLVREALPELAKHFFVAHQYGNENEGGPPEERYRAWPFIREELPQVIAAATAIFCRSGAGTIWECATLGKPMILLPLSGSGTRGDQVENARSLEAAGAALVLPAAAGAADLAALASALAADAPRREAMGNAARAFAARDAASLVAEEIALALEGKP